MKRLILCLASFGKDVQECFGVVVQKAEKYIDVKEYIKLHEKFPNFRQERELEDDLIRSVISLKFAINEARSAINKLISTKQKQYYIQDVAMNYLYRVALFEEGSDQSSSYYDIIKSFASLLKIYYDKQMDEQIRSKSQQVQADPIVLTFFAMNILSN